MSFRSALQLLAAVLAASQLSAEIRLLTGDANHAVHFHDAPIMDVSTDGDLILFSTGEPSTGTTPGISQGGLFLRSLSDDTLSFVGDNSVAHSGAVTATLSDDGRYITWVSSNGNVYWRDVTTSTTRLVTDGADNGSKRPIISDDGRFVAFGSLARNLIADTSKLPATNPSWSVFLYDSLDESVSIISLAHDGNALSSGVGANSGWNEFDFSSDGRFLVFSSSAANAHPDRPDDYTAGFLCVYRRELSNGTLLLLNRNASGALANGNFFTPRCSMNAERVGFFGGFVDVLKPGKMITSLDTFFGTDLYAKDVSSGKVWWGSRTLDGSPPDGAFGTELAMSGDGETLAFVSSGTEFVEEDTDPTPGNSSSLDIFRVDLELAGNTANTTTTLITRSPNDSGNVSYRFGPFLPGSGDYVAFSTSQVEAMQGSGSSDTPFFQGFGVGDFSAFAGSDPLSFTNWAADLPSAQQGEEDNPAKDGVANLVKYFMGMNGSVPDRSQLPVLNRQTGVTLGIAGDFSEYLTLQFRIRRDRPAGHDWSVRAATTPSGLAAGSGSAVQVGNPTPDGDFDTYLFRSASPITSGSSGFMDVKMTAP